MSKENVSQEFRLKSIDETKNYLIEKSKKIYRVLNYIKHLLILISTVTGCVTISSFASLVGIPMGITSSAIELKICLITTGIKKYKSIIKKKKKT